MSVFIIAEAGVNHNGDIQLARELVDVAVSAGVDAVKFQTWKTDLLITHDAKQAAYQMKNTGIEESQCDMLRRLELSFEEFKSLKKYCDEQNVVFLSTPDESESADFLTDLQTIFKIGSGEITNIPFLKHIGGLGKEVILSTGMSNLGEVERALDVLVQAGTVQESITLLHATTQYPASMNEVNLHAMLSMRDAFKIKVGYSDHTLGIEVSLAAVALGASIIEKHFTLSRSMLGPDHLSSLEPAELRAMVKSIRNVEKALGDGVKRPQRMEVSNKTVVRKSIIAKEYIAKGDIFTEDNIATKRVGYGVSAALWDDVLGLYARASFNVDEAIRL